MKKIWDSAEDAVRDIVPGSSVAIAGFGIGHRFPTSLLLALRDQGTAELTVVCNSLGTADQVRAQILAENQQISKLIAAFSARPGLETASEKQVAAGKLQLELVPQGILVERLRAAAAGLGAFYSPVGVGTKIAEGKETRVFGGRTYVLEEALHVDFALIRAHRADHGGNLSFRGGSQNFNPAFAKAARVVIAEVDEIMPTGEIDPAAVDLPGIFVDRIVKSTSKLDVSAWLSNANKSTRAPDKRRYYRGKPALSRAEMARRTAGLLPDDSYVNLGLGIPTLVASYVEGRSVMLHAENGILGYGGAVTGDDLDPDVYNAGGEFVSLLPGASFFDSVLSFEIARSGRLDAVVLGAYQVSEQGDLANWTTPTMAGGAIGGAMDLTVPPNRVIAIMHHLDNQGRSKLVRKCSYPVTAHGCVQAIVTDLGVFLRKSDRFVLTEVAEGFTVEEVLSMTEMQVEVAEEVGVVRLGSTGDRGSDKPESGALR